jgi:hypothetical protein
MVRVLIKTQTRVGMPMVHAHLGVGRWQTRPFLPLTLWVPRAAASPLVGQPSNSQALLGHRGILALLPFLHVVGRGPLGVEADRFPVRFLRGRPGVTCARPLMGRGGRRDQCGRMATRLRPPYKIKGLGSCNRYAYLHPCLLRSATTNARVHPI